MKNYRIEVQPVGQLEASDSAEVRAVSPIEALRGFASDRGFRLEKEDFDYDERGQSLMEEDDGTTLSVIELS